MLLDKSSSINRAKLCQFLEARGIQTRPISGANLAMQPMFSKIPRVQISGSLPVANAIQERGFFVGQSHAYGDLHGELLVDALKAAFTV